MYQLDSTHNLRATADTLDQVHTILTHHLHQNRENGDILWLITGPGAAKASGCIDITGSDLQEGDELIDDVVRHCTESLIWSTQLSRH